MTCIEGVSALFLHWRIQPITKVNITLHYWLASWLESLAKLKWTGTLNHFPSSIKTDCSSSPDNCRMSSCQTQSSEPFLHLYIILRLRFILDSGGIQFLKKLIFEKHKSCINLSLSQNAQICYIFANNVFCIKTRKINPWAVIARLAKIKVYFEIYRVPMPLITMILHIMH